MEKDLRRNVALINNQSSRLVKHKLENLEGPFKC